MYFGHAWEVAISHTRFQNAHRTMDELLYTTDFGPFNEDVCWMMFGHTVLSIAALANHHHFALILDMLMQSANSSVGWSTLGCRIAWRNTSEPFPHDFHFNATSQPAYSVV